MTQFDHTLIDGSSAEKEDGRKKPPVFVGAVFLGRDQDLIPALLEHLPKTAGSCFALWSRGFWCVNSGESKSDVFPPKIHAKVDIGDNGISVNDPGDLSFVSVWLIH
jgi:hypothetical protein